MRTTSEGEDDLPRLVAAITLVLPAVTVRTGVAYLRMRRKAHLMSKVIERRLVVSGLPKNTARKLASGFDEGLSIRSFVRMIGGPLRNDL